MQDFEKLGVFYLGRTYDVPANRPSEDLLLYDAKDLTTHAVCVGMTGSGKTGLCLSLLEEAAIDGIPAIAIDPKGDLGNLLLAFPDLKPEDFLPWVEKGEATRQGMTVEQYAAATAETWRKGLAESGQTPDRIQRYRSAVDVNIYTPGGSAGLPVTILRSFAAPPAALMNDTEAFRGRILSAVSGLLALLGVDADPIRSREHILLSNIFDRAWREGRSLDMEQLIREIQTPPFAKIGVMDLETFFPAKERFELSMQLNNLLASPGFASWMEGEPLDVGRLLYTEQGKPRLSILSIAHLSDAERMFFVTILLNEILAWMRTQAGTSSLRAILYMDEVFGYFPPTANPPSKTPMLTLLKQARAFGLGVVLATQNPVDLDYKGLANAGTWFLGRLQTERDKARVLDGLEGASATAGKSFDRAQMDTILSGLGKRCFLLNNVHEDAPVVFQTRWTLSYLRGPLTREQIQTTMKDRRPKRAEAAPGTMAPGSASGAPTAVPLAAHGPRPVVPPGIPEVFLAPTRGLSPGTSLVYRPALSGRGKLHYVDAKSGVDTWESTCLLLPIDESVPSDVWAESESFDLDELNLDSQPDASARFANLPAPLTQASSYKAWTTALKNHLFQARTYDIFTCPTLKQKSRAGETEADFRSRMKQAMMEQRDIEVERLRKKYAPKLAAIQERIRKAEQQVAKQKSEVGHQTLQTVLNVGATVFGALFSRKMASAGNINKATTSLRNATRIAKEKGDVSQAEETMEAMQARLAELEAEFQAESESAGEAYGDGNPEIVATPLRARKTDLQVEPVTLAWVPWMTDAAGRVERLL